MKKIQLQKFFDSQIQTLKDRGCPGKIVKRFENQKDKVISEMLRIWLKKYPTETIESLAKKGIYLGIPVIPRTYLTIYSQMQMVRYKVRYKNVVGHTYLDPFEIIDMIKTPQIPYYIFDVEDGEAMRGREPLDAEASIKKQFRRCLVDVEVISLGIHTDVLLRHFVDATGSRWFAFDEITNVVPRLCFDGAQKVGRPNFGWCYAGIPINHWGSASCARYSLGKSENTF